MTKIKKTFVNVIKKRYLFLVQFNSTSDAEETAFEATRNMPFSLVLQELSSFQASTEIFNIRHATEKSQVCFVAVILKVLLVNLLAALNFANVFLKIKNGWKI